MPCLPEVVSAEGLGCCSLSSNSAGPRDWDQPLDQSTYVMEPSILDTKAGIKRLCYCHTVLLSTVCQDRASTWLTLGPAPMCFFPWVIPVNLLYNKAAIYQCVLRVLLAVKGGSGWSQGLGGAFNHKHISWCGITRLYLMVTLNDFCPLKIFSDHGISTWHFYN